MEAESIWPADPTQPDQTNPDSALLHRKRSQSGQPTGRDPTQPDQTAFTHQALREAKREGRGIRMKEARVGSDPTIPDRISLNQLCYLNFNEIRIEPNLTLLYTFEY